MTISTLIRKTIAAGDGVTTAFNFAFQVRSAADLQVYFTDAAGTQTLLASNAYGVALNPIPSGQLWANGGTITYPLSGSAIAAGTKLTISRNVALLQSSSLINQGGYYADIVEAALDVLTMEVQQINETIGRALTLPISSSASTALPNPLANAAIGWDPTGTFITNIITAGSIPLPLGIGNGGTGQTTAAAALAALLGAPLASPVFTGNPTAPTPAAGDNDTSIATTAFVMATVGFTIGYKNRAINGDVRIDQANVGAAVVCNAVGPFNLADMFSGSGTGAAGVFSVQQLAVTPPTGFKNYLRVTVTTADAAPAAASLYSLFSAVEGLNVTDFALGTANAVQFTESFWVRSSVAGTFSGAFKNAAASRSYPFTFVINAANTWEQKTVTATGDLAGVWAIDNTVGIYMTFDLGCGANARGASNAWVAASNNGVTGAVRLINTLNATMDITGLQLERGANATAWDYRDFASELLRCQRYYAKTFPQTVAPAQAAGRAGSLACRIQGAGGGSFFQWNFPVPMRAVPTIVTYNPDVANANVRNETTGVDKAVTVDPTGAASTSGIFITDGTGSALNDYCAVHVSASARI